MYRSLLALYLVLALPFSKLSAQDSVVIITQPKAAEITGEPGKYFKPKAVIFPSALIVYGGLKPVISGIEKADDKLWDKMNTRYPDFHTKADDYLMWAPSASVYLMDALKVKTKNRFVEHLIIDAGSIAVTGGFGFVMRKISGNIDVYNKHDSWFPSGHTANAFRGAEFVFQELKSSHPVLSYSGYVFATAVGVLRIYNKTHLLTEVLAGAGLGILSTKLTYLVFDKIKYRKRRQ